MSTCSRYFWHEGVQKASNQEITLLAVEGLFTMRAEQPAFSFNAVHGYKRREVWCSVSGITPRVHTLYRHYTRFPQKRVQCLQGLAS